jgi:DNA-directed DNA polymerase III PolC
MAIHYTPLLYHSNYGLGGSTFKSLFENLERHSFQNCGIVDDTFFGLPEFVTFSKNYNVKPIIGARILLPAPHCENPTQFKKNLCQSRTGRNQSKLYLFIKNQTGYKNLCQILTQQAFKELDLEFIKEHAEGLILLSNSVELLKALKSEFKELFYLLLPPPFIPPSAILRGGVEEQFPPLAAYEIFYVTKQEKIIYTLMCTIKNQLYEHKRETPNHLLTNEKFNTIFADFPQAIRNNKRLSEMCHFIPENRGWVFPKAKKRLYQIIEPKMKTLTPVEKSRIHYEYQIIKNTGFEPYLSLVYHLKEFALSKGIGMNVRGSAASSFILYLLGLSIVNPLEYNLPFERFLNPQRCEPPDIDVDVEFNQRERLIQEIYREFGENYVAHISVINRFQKKARFRNTARAYGISPRELKSIEHHFGEKIIHNIHTLSQYIDNYPHYISCHPSGIVITPQPISTYVPLSPSPAGQITHFDKDGIGMVGLLKIDILGVRGFPSLFLSKESIDLQDSEVYHCMSENKTLGCFQIESPMVRQWLKRIKPQSLMDIANAIAIIRPGPARGGMKEKFLKRVKGEEEINYPHPRLESALRHTLGIPVYQEQILQIAHDFAHFSLSDADMLRRAMTKERDKNRMQELEKLFFSRAQEMNYSHREIETVWERIRSFSSFGFNKAHSITYATLAYLSAYQKFYDPQEFFCQVINNKGGYYPTCAYINEARRWGMRILPPDVNKSAIGFSLCNSLLITGLSEIKNLSLPTIQRILRYRPFIHAQEFFYSVRPSLDEGISLIKSGALDVFQKPWSELYFLLIDSKSSKQRISEFREKLPKFRDFNKTVKLQDQLKTLGFIPEYHILEHCAPHRSTKIVELKEGEKATITGLLIAQRITRTKNNTLMSFLTIDDETGTLEVVLFPHKYKPNSIGPIIEVEGMIKDDSFIAEKCK